MQESIFEQRLKKRNDTIRSQIKEAIEDVKTFAQLLPIRERIIIFGSAARGEAQEHSDVDILIDAETSIRATEIELKIYKFFSERNIKIDLRWIGYCSEEFIEFTKPDWIVIQGGKNEQ